MKVIPVLPVKRGKVMDLHYSDGLKSGKTDHDIFTVMNHLGTIYDTSFLMDLDAYANGNQQIELLKGLCEVNTIWVDPGARWSDDIIDPLVAGGEWVVMGSSTLKSPDELEEAADISDRILPAIHWANGQVIHNYKTGRKGVDDLRHHLRLFADLDFESVLFMDLPKINIREGIDPDIIELLLGSEMNVYLSGGIKEQDVLTYTGLGVTGVLLYINDILDKISRMKPKRAIVEPHQVPEYEPAVQLNPLGFVDYS